MSDVLRILEEVAEGTAPALGEAFFTALVEHLTKAMGVHFAFVAEFADDVKRVRTLALWAGDGRAENLEYDLAGTPCEEVVVGKWCQFAEGVQARFPDDAMLVDLGVESYLGVPLVHPKTHEHLGHLAVMDTKPMQQEPVGASVFRIFAARATAELMRIRAEDRYHLLGTISDMSRTIVGDAPALRVLLERISLVAPTDSTVSIQGETGTGKELVARAIHDQSRRKGRAYVKVNCAALPETLVESELFGHERGAFTGATDRRPGRFELADGGTIFLDEIGDMPSSIQAKLLRVLQEGELERLGGTETIAIDVRVLCATNRDLSKLVEEGRFREDLFYRLEVFPITVPPLRDRPDDIAVLAHHFLDKLRPRLGRGPTEIPSAVMDRLSAYGWPGNVRELENVIERAMILSTGDVLELPDNVLRVRQSRASSALDDVIKQHIESVLSRTSGVIEGPEGAARILGMNSSTLRSRIKKLGIDS